jgi:hypothetical protein
MRMRMRKQRRRRRRKRPRRVTLWRSGSRLSMTRWVEQRMIGI